MPALLFTYGTLQRADVQLASFGRELTGSPDVLPGYEIFEIPINNAEAEAELGITHYYNIRPDTASDVPGTVYELTHEELARADQYEEDADYRRIRVTLRSGTDAWVYIRD
jgi:gamma-glutamylcyclotransferase (GGCT)/AIG2-like uncharacterized protein YtfP